MELGAGVFVSNLSTDQWELDPEVAVSCTRIATSTTIWLGVVECLRGWDGAGRVGYQGCWRAHRSVGRDCPALGVGGKATCAEERKAAARSSRSFGGIGQH